MITKDIERCNQCAICYEICPNYVYSRGSNGNPESIEIRYADHCNACGHCIALCPRDALSHARINNNKLEPFSESTDSKQPLADLILSRRSVRCFKERNVEKEKIEFSLQAAENAGSAGNLQTESFLVIQDRALLTRLEKNVVDQLGQAFLDTVQNKKLIEIDHNGTVKVYI
jgi:NAD-dependent dihydropyrimidine dehydrogenase PreA subunit